MPCTASGKCLANIRASLAMNPMRPLAAFFFHPDGEKRFSRAPGFSFSLGFGPSSIRRAQAIPGPPGRARGLRTREKRGRARSVGERTREPYYLVANPPLPPLVALSCRHHPSPIRRPVACTPLSLLPPAYIPPSGNSSRRASSTRRQVFIHLEELSVFMAEIVQGSQKRLHYNT
jgi:hypothetical protein